MQQRGDLRVLRLAQRALAEKARFQRQAVFGDALYALDGQPAVVRNVGRLGGPGRHGAKTRRDDEQQMLGSVACLGSIGRGLRARVAIRQQSRQLLLERLGRRCLGGHQMHKARTDAGDLVVNRLQTRQKLLDAKIAQGADAVGFALESGQVQGHGGGGLVVKGGERKVSRQAVSRGLPAPAGQGAASV